MPQRLENVTHTPASIPTERVFRRQDFPSAREWIYFCLEYRLEVCAGCQARARKPDAALKRSAARGLATGWRCDDCPSVVHPDLWRALTGDRNPETTCGLCGDVLPLHHAWVSEDGLRLYCSSHLESIRPEDRLREAGRYLEHSLGRQGRTLGRQIEVIGEHLDQIGCRSCSFNGRGIYAESRLVEIDRGERRCDCAPDTLHCAGMASEPSDS